MEQIEYQAVRKYLKQTPYVPERVTNRQYQIARLYFVDQHTMRDIAAELGINQSTVSRTIGVVSEKCRPYIKLPS